MSKSYKEMNSSMRMRVQPLVDLDQALKVIQTGCIIKERR